MANQKSVDFVITGAGPAGSTLARLLAPRFKVMLVEHRRLDRPPAAGAHEKCCGGLLAPDAQKALAQFSIALPESVLGGPQIFAVRALDLKTGRQRLYQRFYLNMDRPLFDRWLASLAEAAGAELMCGTDFLNMDDHGCRVECERKGEKFSVKCKAVIAADGASGRLRSLYGPPVPPEDRYFAIQEEYAGNCGNKHFCAFFDRSLTDFYAWSIPKRDSLLFGGAFHAGTYAPEKFKLLKERLAGAGMTFGKPVSKSGSIIIRPGSSKTFWFGMGRVFAVGEAAGFISPSSAEGLSYAMRSAAVLADVLNRDPDASTADYRRALSPMLFDLRCKMLKCPFMYTPSIRNMIFKSGIGAI